MNANPRRYHRLRMTEAALSWVFAYGSLMWNPGFSVDAFQPGRLQGYHRSLCIYSHHHRGTAARPGLVMGLDAGGMCDGVLVGVRAEREPHVLAYLDERELVTNVYRRLKLPVLTPEATDGTQVEAWCYVVDRSHEQYAGLLPLEATRDLVRQGYGLGGACIEYVFNTLDHLREMGISEPSLETLAASLDRQD